MRRGDKRYIIGIFCLFLSLSTFADEFDWNSKLIEKSDLELAKDSGSISIVVGSNCSDGLGICDISAKYSVAENKWIEFLRESADQKAFATIQGKQVLISLIYYPIGWDYGQKIIRTYEWNANKNMLELRNSSEQHIEI